ncbi:MAG: YiiD C-terminal domain-containing protein [Deltaproteobacteria bacterium]|jgi:acyl-coenzyme A thioesterase PaaI-like protein|nr:YiiD C-terminal domain-containing protein [Deltaproteobacteria bacterium]
MDPKMMLEQGIAFVGRTQVQVLTMEPGYVKMMMPLQPNLNHVGTMYAGALFTLAELPGGAIFLTTFDVGKFYPIIKGMDIKFVKPAATDVTVEVKLDLDEAAKIQEIANERGKADYEWECEVKDANGQVVCVSTNRYQLRSTTPRSA